MSGPWYRDGRFHNLDGMRIPPPGSVGRLLKWRLGGRARPELPDAINRPPRVRALTVDDLSPAPEALRVTWLGHACWLIQLDGCSLITDPTFGRVGYGTVRRLAPPPAPPDVLPRLDAILVSHNHYDHCDLPSLRALRAANPQAVVLTPEGLDALLERKIGGPIATIPWWDAYHLGSVSVTATPAQHWSVRSPGDVCRSHWCGFAVRGQGGSAFFAGDTGFGPHFAEIAERCGPVDAGLLPIGAYAPRWFMRDQHMGPQEAVESARLLSARLLPMHWGTYRLTDEPLDEPPRLAALAAAEAGVPLTTLCPGGQWSATKTIGEWAWPRDVDRGA